MYIRNFKAIFAQYYTILVALKNQQTKHTASWVNLTAQKNRLEKILNSVGKTSNVYEVKAKVGDTWVVEYLVDINPEDIPLILRYRYKTTNIVTENIEYKCLIKKL